MSDANEVERLRASAGQDLASLLDDRSTPAVVEGAALGFPAVARFTPSYLEKKLGTVELAWKLSSSHKHPDFCADSLPKMFAREHGTLADLLRHIGGGDERESSRRLFTGDERFLMRRRDGRTLVDSALAPLLDDVDLAALVHPDRVYTVWAWFSAAGVRTWLHYDNNACHNLNAQLTGEKECVLFSPMDLKRVHPFVLGAGNPATNCSQIDVEAVDGARFPDFARVDRWRATLRAGDVLFIPAWWWHTFRHVGAFNSNVNVWWRPLKEQPNPTARRQAMLDIVARAGLAQQGQPAELLRRLDEAAIDGAVS